MKSEVIIGIVIKGTNVLIVKRKEGEGNLRWQFPPEAVRKTRNRRTNID